MWLKQAVDPPPLLNEHGPLTKNNFFFGFDSSQVYLAKVKNLARVKRLDITFNTLKKNKIFKIQRIPIELKKWQLNYKNTVTL